MCHAASKYTAITTSGSSVRPYVLLCSVTVKCKKVSAGWQCFLTMTPVVTHSPPAELLWDVFRGSAHLPVNPRRDVDKYQRHKREDKAHRTSNAPTNGDEWNAEDERAYSDGRPILGRERV